MSKPKKDVDSVISLIRSAITGEKLLSDNDFDSHFERIMQIASFHDMAHLVSLALIKGGLLKNEENRKFAEKQIFDASYRDSKNRYTLQIAKNLLENAGIKYVVLKGFVIKDYYPESWMRSCCDVDVLVQKQEFDRAVEVFKNNGFEIDGDLNYHDVSLIYDDTNLELHFSVCENIKSIDRVLINIWDNCKLNAGYEYKESNDFFIFHHIAHMSYHFLSGGCGIRPFLDLWILKRAGFFDEEKVKKLCRDAKISEFYDGVEKIIEVWFEGSQHSDITRRIEKYTITGGAYGCFPNNAAAYTIRKGGKVRYIMSLAFPPYVNMRMLYPVLNRIPIALPFYYVYRVFQKTVGRNNGLTKQRYDIIKNQDRAFIKEVTTLMKMLKLDGKNGGKK